MAKRITKVKLLFISVLSIILLDQGSKFLVKKLGSPSIKLIEGFLDIRYTTSQGGVWNLFQDVEKGFRQKFIIISTALGIIFILFLYHRTSPSRSLIKWGLIFILGGALGNFIDRLSRDKVIDFIELYFQDTFKLIAFNLADVFITAGIIMLVVDLVINVKR
jgi:signal peptidase II